MKLVSYPEYKDSGVAWLPVIPADWKIERAKSLFAESNISVRKSDEIVTCFRDGQVTLRRNRRERGFMNALLEVGYQGVRAGQLVVHAMDAFAGAIGVSDSDGKCTPEYVILDARNPEIDLHYYALVLREMARLDYIRVVCPAVRERAPRLRYPNLAAMYLPVPGIEVQKRVVTFSHSLKSRIGKFIRNKRRIIELLKEQKQNVINQAVTRGLDPNVKLKPSGVEWIGEIPEHWEDRYFFQSFREKQVKNEGLTEQNRLSLSYGKIIRKSIDATEGLLPLSFETYQIVDKGNIILRLTDLQNDHKSLRVGLVEERGIITSAYLCLYTLPKIISEFAYLLLHAYDLRKVFYSMGGGVRQSIGFSELRRLPFQVPPESEQAEIVNFIQQETKAIDQAITRAEREIELMREYRARLISDVVTGQVDVRGIEVPEIAEDELLALEEDTAETDDVIDDEGEMDDTD